MEVLNNIIDMISNNGISLVIAGYFIFKDYKQTAQIINILGELRELMAVIKNQNNA